MAREFDGPLTKDDISWLEARLPQDQIDHLKALHGVKGKADSEASQAKVAEKAQAEAAEAAEAAQKAADEAEAQRVADAAQAEVDRARDAAQAADRPPAEDAGEPTDPSAVETTSFDVLKSTEAEVKEWSVTASDDQKAEALALEQMREDRDPRKGVVALLS